MVGEIIIMNYRALLAFIGATNETSVCGLYYFFLIILEKISHD
jgi:hypothetical protein